LLEDAEFVGLPPAIADFPVPEAHHLNVADGEPLAGGRVAQEAPVPEASLSLIERFASSGIHGLEAVRAVTRGPG
jgi:hypothetical protein